MGWRRIFAQNFSFLTQQGFTVSFYEKNSEMEVRYASGSLMIEMILDSYSETMDVILTKDDNRANLLECSLFEKIKRDRLREQLDGAGNVENRLRLYSDFLSANIEKYR